MASASSRVTMRFAPTMPPKADTESHMNARRYALVISLSDATPQGFWCLMIATVGCAKSMAARQDTPRLERHLTALLELVQDGHVALWPRDDDHVLVVLGRGAEQGRATDVDLLEQHCSALAGCRVICEGVEIHGDKIDRHDAFALQLFAVRRVVAPREQRRVDLWMERLHAATQERRRPGHVLNRA